MVTTNRSPMFDGHFVAIAPGKFSLGPIKIAPVSNGNQYSTLERYVKIATGSIRFTAGASGDARYRYPTDKTSGLDLERSKSNLAKPFSFSRGFK